MTLAMRRPAPLFYLILLFMVAAAAAGCTLVVTPPPVEDSNPSAAIFTEAQTLENMGMLSNLMTPSPEAAWSPTAADIAALEADLPAFLRESTSPYWRTDPPIVERVPDYMRQYFGVVVEGRQLIYANFFCTIHDMDWHSELVFVMDGGDCFFQVTYDPQSGEFSDLSVNGEA